jgi:hypothetical protein
MGCVFIALMRSDLVLIGWDLFGSLVASDVDAVLICLLSFVSFDANSGVDGFGTGVNFGLGGNGIFCISVGNARIGGAFIDGFFCVRGEGSV